MNEGELEARLKVIEMKVDSVLVSVEKTRKILLWTGIITVGVIIVPLFLIPLFIPMFLTSQGVGLLSL